MDGRRTIWRGLFFGETAPFLFGFSGVCKLFAVANALSRTFFIFKDLGLELGYLLDITKQMR